MKSLFLLALPRSLSSLAYQVSRQALGLRQPAWTTDGEVLNNDRHVLFTGDTHDAGLKYLCQRHAPTIFDQVTAFLDDAVRKEGFIYKDVVQPFVLARWHGLRELSVLAVRRPVADVAQAVLQRGWRYPAYAVNRRDPSEDDLLRGLLLADRALAGIPAEVVLYDDLIAGEEPLRAALARLYPDHPLAPAPYLGPEFRRTRDRLLERRRSAEHRRLAERLAVLESELPVSNIVAARPAA